MQSNFYHHNKLTIRSYIELITIGWCSLACFSSAQAASYSLPETGDNLIGEIQYTEAKSQDTLLDIARKYDLGFNEITAANPGIDPWLPKQGDRIVLPTRFILPEGYRQGIVVNLAEMRLYYFPEAKKGQNKEVITYPIGIGRQGWATPIGDYHIVTKIEKPSWTMPLSVYEEAIENGHKGRRLIPPGPDNPLGEFAMQLNADSLLIHGTNTPFSIGMRVSRGCLRLYPEDIRSLISMVPTGTSVHVMEQIYKFGFENNVFYMEAHKPVEYSKKQGGINLTPVVSGIVQSGVGKLSTMEWKHVTNIAVKNTGIPVAVFQQSAIHQPVIQQPTAKNTAILGTPAAAVFSSGTN